jgi:hypothetical protein
MLTKLKSLFFAVLAVTFIAGCAGQPVQQQAPAMARTTQLEPTLLEEECRVVNGREVCRPVTEEIMEECRLVNGREVCRQISSSSGVSGSVSQGGRVKPHIPSDIGAAVGKADAARRLAAADIIAACLNNGGSPVVCARAAAPYSGSPGQYAAQQQPAQQQAYPQAQPMRQQPPRGCQSTWSMFPSLC